MNERKGLKEMNVAGLIIERIKQNGAISFREYGYGSVS